MSQAPNAIRFGGEEFTEEPTQQSAAQASGGMRFGGEEFVAEPVDAPQPVSIGGESFTPVPEATGRTRVDAIRQSLNQYGGREQFLKLSQADQDAAIDRAEAELFVRPQEPVDKVGAFFDEFPKQQREAFRASGAALGQAALGATELAYRLTPYEQVRNLVSDAPSPIKQFTDPIRKPLQELATPAAGTSSIVSYGAPVAATLPAVMLAGPAALPVAAGIGGGTGYEQALQAGASENQALVSGLVNTAIGSADAFIPAVRSGLGRIGTAAAINAAQQAASNIEAANISGYDPDRAVSEGVLAAGVAGGLTAGGVEAGRVGAGAVQARMADAATPPVADAPVRFGGEDFTPDTTPQTAPPSVPDAEFSVRQPQAEAPVAPTQEATAPPVQAEATVPTAMTPKPVSVDSLKDFARDVLPSGVGSTGKRGVSDTLNMSEADRARAYADYVRDNPDTESGHAGLMAEVLRIVASGELKPSVDGRVSMVSVDALKPGDTFDFNSHRLAVTGKASDGSTSIEITNLRELNASPREYVIEPGKQVPLHKDTLESGSAPVSDDPFGLPPATPEAVPPRPAPEPPPTRQPEAAKPAVESKPSEPFGPPQEGIVKAPEPDQQTTSARKDQIAADRRELALDELPSPERDAFEASLQRARNDGLDAQAIRIADEIEASPRALTPDETSGMVLRLSDLKKHYRIANDRMKRLADPTEINLQDAEMRRIKEDFDKISKAVDTSGSEKGRALVFQKLTINDDYELLSVLNRAKGAKGQQLTEAETAKIRKLTERVEASEKQLQELETRFRDIQAREIITERRRSARRTPKQLDDEIGQLTEKARSLLRAGCYSS
jgi:hypothetical protein